MQPITMMSRTLSPLHFSNEVLFRLEQDTGLPVRVIYFALHTMADRDGKFIWDARRFMQITLDDLEVIRDVLDCLVKEDFIRKYEVDGKWYGHIEKFEDTQFINPRERQSVIPDCPEGYKSKGKKSPKLVKAKKTESVHLTSRSIEPKTKPEDTSNAHGSLSLFGGSDIPAESPIFSFKNLPFAGLVRYCNRPEELIGGNHEKNVPVIVKGADDQSPVACYFNCRGPVSRVGISMDRVSIYNEVYPEANNLQRIKKAALWMDDNKARAKTASGLTKFIGSWLNRAQNNGDDLLPSSANPVKSNLFKSRGYQSQSVDDYASDVGNQVADLISRRHQGMHVEKDVSNDA